MAFLICKRTLYIDLNNIHAYIHSSCGVQKDSGVGWFFDRWNLSRNLNQDVTFLSFISI
jgi:hypothetical protein